MKIKPLLAFVVATLAATPALAQGNFYVLAAGGVTHASNLDEAGINQDITDAGLTVLSSNADKNDMGYKLQAGYQFTPYLALEGGYVNLGEYKYGANLVGGSAEVKAEVDGWNLGVVGTFPLANNFGLFAKLGMIDVDVDVSGSASGTGGTASVAESSSKWKTNWSLGGTYGITKNLGVRLEYEEFRKVGDADTTGESDINLWSLGLSYRF